MQGRELPKWMRWGVAVATIAGPMVAIFLAAVAYQTAEVAKLTAEIASREFALSRRPLVVLTDWQPRLESHADGTTLFLGAVFKEVLGIPTTVHSVRARHFYRWEGSNEGQWRAVSNRDIPLYGDHVIRGMILGSVDAEPLEAHKAAARRLGSSLSFVYFTIEYSFSVQGGPREQWRVGVTVSCDENGIFTVSQTMPDIEVFTDDEARTGH